MDQTGQFFTSTAVRMVSLSDETLNRDPMTIFQDKRLPRTDCEEAGDYVVPNVF